MQQYIAEFIGTMILILLGDGVVAGVLLRSSKAEHSGWIVITFGWAMAVAIAVYVVGAVLVWIAYYDHWKVTDDPVLKRGVFCTIPEIRNTIPNFMTEVIGTAVLLFGVVAIVTNAQTFGGATLPTLFSTSVIPLIIGFIVLAIGLSLGGPTGYAINPARDLGPRIAHAILPIPGKGDSDWSYSWIPVVAPLVGGVIGAGLYIILGLGS